MWSKVKASLRAPEARTYSDLLAAFGHALRCVTAHGFAACGWSLN